MMNVHQILAPVLGKIRKNRMEQFCKWFGINSETTILDVGGTPLNWSLIDEKPKVTLMNLGKMETSSHSIVIGDGCLLPFKSKSFDLVFSNSVIEHVQGEEKQQAFAKEISRVGKSYYVQTPNRSFFLEPHLFTPFIHWLPKRIQKKIAGKVSVRAIIMRLLKDNSVDYLDDVNLLNKKELLSFFPTSKIVYERWLGMTKSIIAISKESIE